MLEKIQKASLKLNKWLSISVGGFLALLIAFLLMGESFMRTVLDNPIKGVIEICETMMVWIILSAVTYALITDTHVRVVLVLNRLPSRVRSGFECFSNIAGFIFFALLTWAGWRFFWESLVEWRIPMAPLGLPLFIGAVFIPIGCGLMSLQFLIDLIAALRMARVPVGEEEVREEPAVHGI